MAKKKIKPIKKVKLKKPKPILLQRSSLEYLLRYMLCIFVGSALVLSYQHIPYDIIDNSLQYIKNLVN